MTRGGQLCKKYPNHRYVVAYEWRLETYRRRMRNRYALGTIYVIPTMDKGALWAVAVLAFHIGWRCGRVFHSRPLFAD